MTADFIDTDQLVGKDCKLKKSKLETCCCEVDCQVTAHYNLHHKFEDVDSVLWPVQLGEVEESAWEALDTYKWDSVGPWDTNINVDDVLGMKQAQLKMERENSTKPVAFNITRHLMIPLLFLQPISRCGKHFHRVSCWLGSQPLAKLVLCFQHLQHDRACRAHDDQGLHQPALQHNTVIHHTG